MKSLRIGSVFLCLCLAVFLCCAQNPKGNLVDDVPTQGALNAIKKAYQMTDIMFIPQGTFVANSGKKVYYGGERYQGLGYSSVKEIDTYVGMDVSFHTFMTAIHNPRSVIYTENVSKPPYHGKNCAAYYGTVCSGLVAYALGFRIYKTSYDINKSDDMQLIDDQSAMGIQLVDVMWRSGHVALITGIKRNPKNGRVAQVEISQAQHRGCYRFWVTSEKAFNDILQKGKWKIYRYKYLDHNTEYKPLTDFVAIGDEKLTPFKYNDDICTSKGDKACYIVGDSVILNIAKGFEKLEIFKDSTLYQTIKVGKNIDISVAGLPYGNYKARVVKGNKKSDYTYWQMIDVSIKLNKRLNTVSFHSANAIPIYLEFCSVSGGRPTSGVFELTKEDILRGYIDVSRFTNEMSPHTKNKYKYVKVHFECEYGRVTNKPVKWIK